MYVEMREQPEQQQKNEKNIKKKKDDFKRWLDLINPALFCVFVRSFVHLLFESLGSGWIVFFLAIAFGNHAIVMIMMFAHLLICFRNHFDLCYAPWCLILCDVVWCGEVHMTIWLIYIPNHATIKIAVTNAAYRTTTAACLLPKPSKLQ